MALINCPECGKEISDKAPKCPNCGKPLSRNRHKENLSRNLNNHKQTIIKSSIIIICFILVISLLVGYKSITKDRMTFSSKQQMIDYLSGEYEYSNFIDLSKHTDNRDYDLVFDTKWNLTINSNGSIYYHSLSEDNHNGEIKKEEFENTYDHAIYNFLTGTIHYNGIDSYKYYYEIDKNGNIIDKKMFAPKWGGQVFHKK